VENTGLLYCSGGEAITETDTSINWVRFTSFDTTTGWGSLVFDNVDTSLVKFSLFEYAKTTAIVLNSCSSGVKIIESEFKYNSSDSGPGAIEINGGNPEISFNNFHDNKSETNGGALLITANAASLLNRNIIWQNEAFNFGGGISISSCSDSMSVLNNTLCGNVANTGGAIYVNDCMPLILNDILWLNNAQFGPEIYVNSVSFSPIVDYCDIYGGYPDGGDSVISSDPLFADPGQGDFSITWLSFPVEDETKSPCIDAGHPDMILFMDDDSTRIDIGAISFDQVIYGLPYLPADANMRVGQWPPQVIGSDVTYLVSYFRGITRPCIINGFYCSGDANGDCQVIGSDVTRMVTYFRGLANIIPCPDYEPAWPTPDELPGEAPSGWPNCETAIVNDRATESGLNLK
jgi:hypothetical protein